MADSFMDLTTPTSPSQTSTPAPQMTPSPSKPLTQPPRKPISPAMYQYLQKQMRNIVASGGSEADVAKFLELETSGDGVKIPPVTVAPSPNRVDMPSELRGISMNALQGITFGFGDEVMGSLLGALTGEGARAGREEYRRELEAWNQTHRKTAIAAEIAGAVLTGSALAKVGGALAARVGGAALRGAAEAAPTFLQRAVSAAAQGGAAGGAYAAGSAQGGVGDRTKAALVGGAFGAVTGGLLSGASQIGGAVTKPALRSLLKGKNRLQALVPGLGTPADHAKEFLVDALEADGVDLATAKARAATLAKTGIPVTAAELGGESTLQLASDAVAQRTPAKQRLVEDLMQRQATQGERLSGALLRTIFRGGRLGLANAHEAIDELATRQASAAAPLYQDAFKQTVKLTPRMQKLLEHPMLRKAYAAGRSIAKDEDLAGIGHGLKVPPLPDAQGGLAAQLAAMGVPADKINAALTQGTGAEMTLPVKGLDYMKRGLDVVIQGATKGEKPSLDRRGAATLRSMLGEILDEADGQVPAYASARQLWGGFEQAKGAVSAGMDFLKLHPYGVKKAISDLPPWARDFYRLGAAQSLHDKVMAVAGEKADVASRYFGGRLATNKSLQGDRILALFPDAPETAQDFMRKVAGETRVSYTTQKVARSPRGASFQQREQQAEGLIPTVRNSFPIALLNAVRSGIVGARGSFSSEVSDNLSMLLTKGLDDPAELYSLIDDLNHTRTQMLLRGRTRSVGAIVAGGQAGRIPGA